MTTSAGSLEQGFLELSDSVSLYHGGVLDRVRLAWRLSGEPGAPVVLVLGGISANRVVFSEGDQKGWWDTSVGPGRALDPHRFRILGIDFLGGSAETTGPSHTEFFPSISTYDQADLIARLLDHLSVKTLHTLIGPSYGGMVGLAFAEKFPRRVERLLVISAADRTHPLSTAWRCVQRRTLRYALKHGEGGEGVILARALAMATYRSSDEFDQRFRAAPKQGPEGFVFPVEEYLFARGADYAARYRAPAFICLSESIDLHSVDASRIKTPTTLVAFREDQLVPLADMRALHQRLSGPKQLFEFNSLYGHDAFLKEAAALAPIFTSVLTSPAGEFRS